MPLSFAGLISGMLTLIATTPNLIVDAELTRSGYDGFGFFTITPIGLVVLALGIGYQLIARRLLGEGGAQGRPRRTFETLLADYRVDVRTHRYRVERRSSLNGTTLAEIDLGDWRARVLMVERTRLFRRTVRTSADDVQVQRSDVLFVDAELPAGELERLHLTPLSPTEEFFGANSRQLGLAEILIAPDSGAAGKSVRDLRFHASHDLVVLGVRHAGRIVTSDFATARLAVGDTLLASGAWDAVERIRAARSDYIVLDLPAEVDEVAPAANQAPFAIASVLVMVTGIVPNVIAALIACLLLGIFRCIDMPSAYRAIHWPTILLIVGMLPFAAALEQTGGVDLVVDGLLGVLGDAGPQVLLGGIFVLTAVIGLFVSNTATAVLMAPIAISTAVHLGVSPLPFAIVVALAASSAFMTPVSSPVNTLVVEPGRYRFGDFVKVGAPFTVVVLIVSVLLVPVLMPL